MFEKKIKQACLKTKHSLYTVISSDISEQNGHRGVWKCFSKEMPPVGYLSFPVIGFEFCRFCGIYRITRELKKSKMLPHWEMNPASDFPLTFMSYILPLS